MARYHRHRAALDVLARRRSPEDHGRDDADEGSSPVSAVKRALENLAAPFEGVTGTYARPFTPTDHEAVRPESVIMGVVRGGTVIPSPR